jgi:hypothetical protein
MPTERAQDAQKRIERCRQRCIDNIVAARMEYATKSARIEAEIDEVNERLARSSSEKEPADKRLQQLKIDLGSVEIAFWNAKKWFIESARFLGIEHEDAVLYLGGWDNNVEGAIPMNVQQHGERSERNRSGQS